MTTNEENSIEFWSSDKRFGVRLNLYHLARMILKCQQSYPNETGGILVGFYNTKLDCAEIAYVFFETPDSKKGRTWFIRGIFGLQNKLDKLWLHKKVYYLGEWHFHPNGTANPSQVDVNQMFNISSSSKIHCPEPILLIFAGTNLKQEILYRAFVFFEKQIVELEAV